MGDEPLAHRLARKFCTASNSRECWAPDCGLCWKARLLGGQVMAEEVAATYEDAAAMAAEHYYGSPVAERLRRKAKEVMRDETA